MERCKETGGGGTRWAPPLLFCLILYNYNKQRLLISLLLKIYLLTWNENWRTEFPFSCISLYPFNSYCYLCHSGELARQLNHCGARGVVTIPALTSIVKDAVASKEFHSNVQVSGAFQFLRHNFISYFQRKKNVCVLNKINLSYHTLLNSGSSLV